MFYTRLTTLFLETKMIKALKEPETRNLFPRCVAMKLHFETAGSCGEKLVSNVLEGWTNPGIDISLTIDFGSEQEILVPAGLKLGLPEGKVRFGIRRGELELLLTNCRLPQESVILKSELNLVSPGEITIENSNKLNFHLQSNEKGSLSGKASAEVGSKQQTKINQSFCKVSKIGEECNPLWVFEVILGENSLKGNLTQQALGTLKKSTESDAKESVLSLKATFSVRGEDAVLSWGKIAFTSNITRNKMAGIERAIALRYIKFKLQEGPLSVVSWNYG